MSNTKAPIIAKKSYSSGMVSVSVNLKASGYKSDRIKVEGSTDITSEQARQLAFTLIQQADAADAKVAAKVKSEENRRKYREREIAAGRLIVMRGSPF
jgi:hypothetical protein